MCGSVEVTAVCFPLDHSFAWVSASGLRPSVSHKVSAPVCVSLLVSPWYVSRSLTISGPCSFVCVGIIDSRNRSLLCALPASLYPPDWAGLGMESPSLERVTRSYQVLGQSDQPGGDRPSCFG